jgi:beta-glucanase (GH16 family)
MENNKFNIEEGTENISGIVKFSPKKIAALGGYHNEKYLLPIKIVSEDISVKENREHFYFSFNIDSLIFEDNFDGPGNIPNPDYWSLCTRYWSDWNRYLSESYDQAYVENGNLVLKTEKVDDQYLTGGVETKDKFFFQHGKVSVRARFTKLVQGGWPAIWMMPQTPTYSGGWPNGGEIDIMEHLNKENVVHHAVHSYYSKNNDDSNEATSAFREGEYNVYEIEWNEDEIKFYVNGIEGFKYKNADYANEEVTKQWPFNAPFYLILNNSLGGEGTWPGIINDAELPGIMEVDWVRVTK